MNILVLGGQLQGTEITYLAKEAGWHVTVVDKNEAALASLLCDCFYCLDIRKIRPEFYLGFDLVFPAIEDLELLQLVKSLTNKKKIPFAFDEAAFALSRSKRRTNSLLQDLKVPIPPLLEDHQRGNEESNLGYIVKPDISSGSKGVQYISDRCTALSYLANHEDCLGQAFIEGPVYSIEVVCKGKTIIPRVVTEVVINAEYDCIQIIAPATVSATACQEIQDLSATIGRALNMRGLFDLELIRHHGHLFVLEIDARMPSQTPMAIYHATGINLVVETAKCFLEHLKSLQVQENTLRQQAVLQHVRIQQDHLDLIGEGTLAHAPPLQLLANNFGREVVLASRDKSSGCIYATLIVVAQNSAKAIQKLMRIATKLASVVPERTAQKQC